MIRVRDYKNHVIEVPHHTFVEICDGRGEILYMIYTDETGEIHVLKGNTPESKLYEKQYKTRFFRGKPKVILL